MSSRSTFIGGVGGFHHLTHFGLSIVRIRVGTVDTPFDTDNGPTTCLLSTMSAEEIAWLLHHDDRSFSSVQPCDTTNGTNTKTHWLAEELHRIMGCRKFCNYKHLLQVS